ncbi:MAG TPA: type 1 glutamine amidotransferase [Burkholderiales bacterium]|nr:type 1 glutamine amidotransferase [Burkholderiales bacterium]
MKPVAIIRTSPSEGPAYFATYLEGRSVPLELVALDRGDAVPRDARRYSGLCFMGGPMSVNDDLPWIAPALELIREAVRKDVPVIGHCLGGQLMSKALGGVVGPSPVREMGWGEVRVCDNSVARAWLGELSAFESFHWHGETFSIPPGATRILENDHCANQAFAIGPHLGMQCHVEMTVPMIESWLKGKEHEHALAARAAGNDAGRSAGVQSAEEIRRDIGRRVEALHAVADRLYERWTLALSEGD